MFRHFALSLFVILAILVSCNKDDNNPIQAAPPFAKLNNSTRTFEGYIQASSANNPKGDTGWKDSEIHTFYVYSDSSIKIDDTASSYNKHYYQPNHQYSNYDGWLLFEHREAYRNSQIWYNVTTDKVEIRGGQYPSSPISYSSSWHYWEQ